MSWTAPGLTVTRHVRRADCPSQETSAVTGTVAALPESWPPEAVTLAPVEADSRRAALPPDQATRAPAGRLDTDRVTDWPTRTEAVWGRVGAAAGVTVRVQAPL